MRIAHVITRLLRAGSEENTIASCQAQLRRGHDVMLLCGPHADPVYRTIAPDLRIVEIPDLCHPVRPLNDVRAVAALADALRRFAPDLVHTHQSKAGILGRVAARIAGVPKIVHGVHILPFERVSWWKGITYMVAERAAAQVTDAFVDVSVGVRSACIARGIGHPDRHHVVHSGFPLDQFRTARPPLHWRTILRLEPDCPRPPVLVMLASFEPRKRHLDFLQTLPPLLDRHPNLRLLLVGDGPERGAVAERIATLGLDENVIRTGYREDPERLVALADLCLLTSCREGLPRVVLQYLAAGKPAIVSDLPGLTEVLEDGVNGLITPPDDLTATTQAIAELLDCPKEIERLGQGARETDVSSWDVNVMCTRLEAIYAQLLAAPHQVSDVRNAA